MKTFKIVAIIAFLLFICGNLFSQRNCGSPVYQQENLKEFPELRGRYNALAYIENYSSEVTTADQIITIPVVVHVVYKRPEENVTDEQIKRQIDILNEDYGGKNADSVRVPPVFKKVVAGDCRIRFKLEAITRDTTAKDIFYMSSDDIKRPSAGGVGMGKYSSNKFLNIWTGNILMNAVDDLLGYATFPGQAPIDMDGVAIHYKVMGTPGLNSSFNKGRTGTHEIGHWLGLQHLWGDTHWNDPDCAEDGISDTPMQQICNSGCPAFPHNSECENNSTGDMFMNYMDYVDDECMVMFSEKQKNRMRANFMPGGLRVDIVRGNAINLSLLTTDPKRNDELSPVITKFKNDSISWTKVEGVSDYIISLKSLETNKTSTFTTKKLSAVIQGLDSNSLYEIQVISVQTGNKDNMPSNPLLILPKETEEKIQFHD